MPAPIKIVSPGKVATDTRVYIDGKEVPRDGMHTINLNMAVGDIPQLTLTFHASEIEIDHGKDLIQATTGGTDDA